MPAIDRAYAGRCDAVDRARDELDVFAVEGPQIVIGNAGPLAAEAVARREPVRQVRILDLSADEGAAVALRALGEERQALVVDDTEPQDAIGDRGGHRPERKLRDRHAAEKCP